MQGLGINERTLLKTVKRCLWTKPSFAEFALQFCSTKQYATSSCMHSVFQKILLARLIRGQSALATVWIRRTVIQMAHINRWSLVHAMYSTTTVDVANPFCYVLRVSARTGIRHSIYSSPCLIPSDIMICHIKSPNEDRHS